MQRTISSKDILSFSCHNEQVILHVSQRKVYTCLLKKNRLTTSCHHNRLLPMASIAVMCLVVTKIYTGMILFLSTELIC